jgi:hypothetical protein
MTTARRQRLIADYQEWENQLLKKQAMKRYLESTDGSIPRQQWVRTRRGWEVVPV